MTLPTGRKPLDQEWFTKYVTELPDVNRVEVIDDTGRAYSKWDVRDVQLQIQDEDRTLKIFLKGKPDEPI